LTEINVRRSRTADVPLPSGTPAAALDPDIGASARTAGGNVAAGPRERLRAAKAEQTHEPLRSRKVSGASGGGTPASSEIGDAAARHGRALLQRSHTVDEIVHDYGDLTQAITDLAIELDADIAIDEYRTLNRCLDNAIANAVTEFSYQRGFMQLKRMRSNGTRSPRRQPATCSRSACGISRSSASDNS
jgi:hypothetical protein